ncbi:MAG: SRPBCC domain-containing protein [Ferruginibacter sp.]
MQKLQFNIQINAPKEKVWEKLWADETYRQWTSVFAPGSQAVSDWQEGSKIYFGDGKGNGMYSIIHKKTENSLMVFKHMGEIKNGEEKESEWAGSEETYILTGSGNTTELAVELDVTKDFEEYFNDKFPKALAIVKQLSEK